MSKRVFTVILEQDEDGWFIADVPELEACYTQGKTKKEALKSIREAIQLCLEVQEGKKTKPQTSFVSVEKVAVYQPFEKRLAKTEALRA